MQHGDFYLRHGIYFLTRINWGPAWRVQNNWTTREVPKYTSNNWKLKLMAVAFKLKYASELLGGFVKTEYTEFTSV